MAHGRIGDNYICLRVAHGVDQRELNMDQIIELLQANWEWALLAFMIAEKIVKISPSRKDDIILDVVWDGIKQLVGKGKK